jgi:hypothetical protein
MNLNEIIAEWKIDCKIDQTELGEESIRTINLHSKYMEWYKKEKYRLINLEVNLRPPLKLAKREFYVLGPHEDTPEDWVLPAHGRVLRGDVEEYLAADTDLIQMNLKIAVQSEIVSLLLDILKELQNRRWAVKNAIEFMKLTSGVG